METIRTGYWKMSFRLATIGSVNTASPVRNPLPRHGTRKGQVDAAIFLSKRQMIEEAMAMKAIVVTDEAAGTAGMKLSEKPAPQRRRLR